MSSPPELDLVVVGDCNPDVLVLGDDVTPAFGQQEKLVGSVSLVIGGSAAITAVAAARLGLRVALVAAVGADPAGTFMLDQLSREGVGVDAVVIRDAAPTGMTVALSRGEDRAILTALGAVDSLTAADIPAAVLARARHVHVSSYFLLERSLGPGLRAVLATARAAGATTSLDTNWDPSGRWGDERLIAAIAEVDILLPNEAEALRLSRAASLGDAARTLVAAGPRLVVKLGERGALCADAAVRHTVRLPAVTTVDATGAGDCFNAGLIAGLSAGLELPQAAALGCAAGALSTAAPGGTASAPDMPAAAALARHASVAVAAAGETTLGYLLQQRAEPRTPAASGTLKPDSRLKRRRGVPGMSSPRRRFPRFSRTLIWPPRPRPGAPSAGQTHSPGASRAGAHEVPLVWMSMPKRQTFRVSDLAQPNLASGRCIRSRTAALEPHR